MLQLIHIRLVSLAINSFDINDTASEFQSFFTLPYLAMATSNPSERTPLLNGAVTESSTSERLVSLPTVGDGPSWSDSFGFLFFGSYLNILLVFVPLSYISHILYWDAALRFSFSFLAIIPLAQVWITRLIGLSCFLHTCS